MFDGKLVIRFVAADFSGEIVTHCQLMFDCLYELLFDFMYHFITGHFLRHEDLGMMDTFLIEATPLADNEDIGDKNLVIALAVCGSMFIHYVSCPVAINHFLIISRSCCCCSCDPHLF